jgi:hypothetical protein
VESASNKVDEVKCLRSECPFRVCASQSKCSKQWKCSSVEDHTCVHELVVRYKK